MRSRRLAPGGSNMAQDDNDTARGDMRVSRAPTHSSRMENPHRDVALDLAVPPRDWCAGDPFTTTFMASLSMLFPEGERFFVDSVKAYRRAVPPELEERVAGFIGQEAMHGREHRAFNALLGDT